MSLGARTPDARGRVSWTQSIGHEGTLSFPRQAEMDMVAWGVDLASVEQHIDSHRSIHNAIGDYRWQLDKIKADLVLGDVSVVESWKSIPKHCVVPQSWAFLAETLA